jgi:hypothetical protein
VLILLIVLPPFTSEQQPLRLNPAEISEVIAEVCSEATSNANPSIAPSRLTTQSRQPSADVAFSVLIKLVIDMYNFIPFSFTYPVSNCYLGAAVKLLPCDHELMGPSPENSLLQKMQGKTVHKT